MEIHDFVGFKQRELKRLKLEEELVEQLCNWLDDITNKLTLLNIEWQVNSGGYDIGDDYSIFTMLLGGKDFTRIEFEVRKIAEDTYIYTVRDVHMRYFKKQEYKYESSSFATKEFIDKIGGKK